MYKKLILFLFCIISSVSLFCPKTAEAKTIDILFIGNSLTYRDKSGEENYFIKYFQGISKAAGKNVKCQRLTKNGGDLSIWTSQSSYKKQLVSKLKATDFEYIVIQENTDFVLKKSSTSKKSIKSLFNLIDKYDKSYVKVYNATWNYKNGKYDKSYSSGQKIINDFYYSIKKTYGGKISYSGKAFAKSRKTYNNKLWVKDNNHPTYTGSYLSACCMYDTIFNKSCYGNTYNSGFSKTTLKRMQKIADSIN